MKRAALALTLIGLLVGCGGSSRPASTSNPDAPPTIPPPTATPTPLPSPGATAAAFLSAWEAGDYATMYARISPAAQAARDFQSFFQRYRTALSTATAITITTQLQAVLQENDRARAAFHLTWDTGLVGTLATDAEMALSFQDGQWWVDWDDGLIWPELKGGNLLSVEYQIPARANIYDWEGRGLAAEGVIVTVGVIPGQIQDEPAVLAALALVTGLPPEEIYSRYAGAPADWRIPIADIPAQVSVDHNDLLAGTPGIYREEKEGRTYWGYGVAPHVIGWVSPIPAERLEEYKARGYRGDEWVGVAGLEAWGDEVLGGRHGGTLSIITPEGQLVATLAQRAAVPGRTIYTTLDREFQVQVEEILGGRKGAIVVLDVNSGAVLALASGPGFNQNIFVGPGGAVDRAQVLSDPRNLLFNRATQGTYPCGSVLKVVTMAAAMEEAGMTADTPFFCPGYWEGLGPAARKTCWLETGHGDIGLQDGLTASCDVVFYILGQTLDGISPEVLPEYIRGFGMGVATGLVGVAEADGLVPDPEWKRASRGEGWGVGDTVNIAIGQGYLLVTPLQIARMMAAVGNGGTLYRPYVVARIAPAGEEYPEWVAQPEVVGQLPVSAGHLASIQAGLLGVTTHPLGTADHRFVGLSIPIAGKTGTAEVGGPDTRPHSWFAGYAPAYAPEIALVVVVENAGEGATVAAPLFRQVVEAYYGLPLTPLPPQAEEGYVPPTPTPEP